MNLLKIIPTAFILSACVMAGKPFWQPAEFKQPPASGKARMVFYWPKYQYDVMPYEARIFINGEFIENIGYLKYHAADTAPGTKAIAIDAWKTPGKCTIKVTANANGKHFFEISLRSDYLARQGAANAISKAAGGEIESAVSVTKDALSKNCSGMFSVMEVSEEQALHRMAFKPANTH